MLETGMQLLCGGKVKTVAKWRAEWSIKMSGPPHTLFILWEGETEYEKFVSTGPGEFVSLEVLPCKNL